MGQSTGGRGLPAKTFLATALLALDHGNFASRTALAERLWDHAAAPVASLRTLLYLVQKWERASGLTVFRHDLASIWRDEGCVPSDLDAFLKIETIDGAEELSRLCDLYRGELLDGVDAAPDSVAGEALTTHRRTMAHRFAGLALPAAARIGGAVGERAVRRVLADAPYDETVVRHLLRLLAEDSKEQALREFQQFEQRLQADLGASPEPETSQLAAELGLVRSRVSARAGGSSGIERILEPSANATAGQGSVPRVLILPPGPSPYRFGPDQLLLTASFVDDVTLTLCKQRLFAVIAPHSARQIAQGSPSGDASTYGADYLLATRLMPADGDSLRLGLSFVRLRTQEVLMGEDLRFAPDDLPARHIELAEAVAGRLAGTIAKAEIATYRKTGAASAYVQYLLGQERLQVIELKDLRRARKAFRRALDLQPDFTPAISMLARTLTLEWLILGRLERDLLAEARQFAQKAVDLNPFEAAGHRELGHVALYMQDYEESLSLLDHARSLAPHHADILMNEADVLVHNSRPAEARPLVELAMGLNPLAPDEYFWIGATVEFFTERFGEALATVRRMKNPEPAARLAAACAAMAGDTAAAERYRIESLARHPDFRLADWRKLIGLKSEADKDLYVGALRKAGFT